MNKNQKVNSHQKNEFMERQETNIVPMQVDQIIKLFEDELDDIYWAEEALTNMIQNETAIELIEELAMHLEETHEQVELLAKALANMKKNL